MDEIFSSRWICAPFDAEKSVVEFKKTVSAGKKITEATLFSSAVGVYAVKINKTRADVYPLAPGWTKYECRVQYQRTDVTALLRPGDNDISICAGRGFLCQAISHDSTPRVNLTGLDSGAVAVIAALVITYDDGETENIFTDGTWTARETKWRESDMYDGDVYDDTFEPSREYPARALDAGTTNLIAQEGERIAEFENLPVSKVIKTPKGETVLDFGQNLTGYLKIRIRGERGGVCKISYGEALDKNGNFYNENYRAAKAETTVICSGSEFIFKPEFTFYGFRYARIDEWSGELKPDDFTAIVVHSEMERTGHFECSNEMLNKLYHNIIRGQKGNFLDVPTDCPQRDERMGWTGDAQVFSTCAAMNFNVLKFFKKWLGDMRACQKEDGRIPVVVPSYWSRTSAAWSDACVIIPYNLYVQYGDKTVLSENYEMMRRWVDYLCDNFDDYVGDENRHYGDWLALERQDSCNGMTPKGFIAASYSARSTELFIKISEALGIVCEKYREFYNVCRERIRRDYCDEEAYAASRSDYSLFTQTYYALRLSFGLFDTESERKTLASKLNDMIISCGCRLTTGFVGTPCLLYALSDNGYEKTAYSLLLREEYPSWIYPITKGATTIWEHWDGIKENGDFWKAEMNSFNHYAYGAVGDWLYSVMAGIKPAAPGYEKILFKPKTDRRVKHVSASIKTKFGVVSSEITLRKDEARYVFTVPEKVSATAVIGDQKYKLNNGKNTVTVKL